MGTCWLSAEDQRRGDGGTNVCADASEEHVFFGNFLEIRLGSAQGRANKIRVVSFIRNSEGGFTAQNVKQGVWTHLP